MQSNMFRWFQMTASCQLDFLNCFSLSTLASKCDIWSCEVEAPKTFSTIFLCEFNKSFKQNQQVFNLVYLNKYNDRFKLTITGLPWSFCLSVQMSQNFNSLPALFQLGKMLSLLLYCFEMLCLLDFETISMFLLSCVWCNSPMATSLKQTLNLKQKYVFYFKKIPTNVLFLFVAFFLCLACG